MRSRALITIGLVAISCVLTACGGHRPHAVGSAGNSAQGLATVSRSSCPVTVPHPWQPPRGVSPSALFGAGSAAGNGKLWVGGLWPEGVIAAGPAFVNQGSVSMKFGWWRNVRGHLHITGRRLDAPAPPVRADIPDYGVTGFQASGVTFPTEGCWQVTGMAGPTRLTFVTLVVSKTTTVLP